MAKVVSYNGHGRDKAYVQCLLEGFRRRGYDVIYNSRGEPDLKFVVYQGEVPKYDEERAMFAEAGVVPLIIDLGYMRRSQLVDDQKAYYQVSVGHIGWVPQGNLEEDRFLKLGLELKEDRGTEYGRKVMIAGQVPGDTQHRMNNDELGEFYLQQFQNLREDGVPEEEIYLRTHPYAPLVPPNAAKYLKVTKGKDEKLDDALADCRAVVTFNSTIFYDATLRGIPVVSDDSAHYRDLSFERYADIKPIRFGAKRTFLNRMAHAQWTLDEMYRGDPVFFINSQIEDQK